MRRFDADDNDEFQEELEQMFDYEFDEDFATKNEILNVLQLDLVELDINQKILVSVIKMLERTFLWRFKSHHKKIKMISETYEAMYLLLERNSSKKKSEDMAEEIELLNMEELEDEDEDGEL